MDVKYEVYTLKGVIEELEKLSKKKGTSAQYARAALHEVKKMKLLDIKGNPDDILLNLASRDTIICTNDKVLKEKIRKKGAPIIYLRQKKYLTIEGYLK